jgi:hypothetical protein
MVLECDNGTAAVAQGSAAAATLEGDGDAVKAKGSCGSAPLRELLLVRSGLDGCPYMTLLASEMPSMPAWLARWTGTYEASSSSP